MLRSLLTTFVPGGPIPLWFNNRYDIKHLKLSNITVKATRSPTRHRPGENSKNGHVAGFPAPAKTQSGPV